MSRLFLTRSTTERRLTAALATIFVFLLVTGLALAQGIVPQKIKIGDTVTGTLDTKTFAQVYAYDGLAGDVITVTATSKVQALRLALVITAPNGTVLSQSAELNKADVTAKDLTLSADGTYQITVLRAAGVTGTAKGDYTLALTGTPAGGAVTGAATAAAGSGATFTLPQGISIMLSWSTKDDMNLEVRDPVGGAVNYRTPAVPSGGRLSQNVNPTCATATADNPTETVNWPAGNVYSGS